MFWVGPEQVPDQIESGAEPGFGEEAMDLAGRGAVAQVLGCGPRRPSGGQRDDGGQQMQLSGAGQAGVLKVQPADLGIAEEVLDGPSPARGAPGTIIASHKQLDYGDDHKCSARADSQSTPVAPGVGLRGFRDQPRDLGAHLVVVQALFSRGHVARTHSVHQLLCATAVNFLVAVDFHPELMGWIPPPDGIAMCQGDVG